MKRLLIAIFLAVSFSLIGTVYASPVEVTSCPFLMESNMQYIVTQDLVCDNFPYSFIDLSNSPINSSVSLNGHTIDVVYNNFIGDWGVPYDIEVYGGNVINCGEDGGGCIQWGGSGGTGILYLHDMNISTNGNFVTTNLNGQPGKQRIENVNLYQQSGSIFTGWFLDLHVINFTAAALYGTSVFYVDGGDYFLTNFNHTGYPLGDSSFGSQTTVTLLNTDIDTLAECGIGCDLVTWIMLENPKPLPIVNVTTSGDLILQFRYGANDSIICGNCNGTTGNAALSVTTNKVSSIGCDYIHDSLESLLSLPNSVKLVHIDRDVCSDKDTLLSVPVLSTLDLTNPNSKKYFLF